MKFTFLFLLLFLSHSGTSQIQGSDEVYLKGDLIEATFNGGGLQTFQKYINQNFNFSKATKEGKREATFTVDELGAVRNIRITQILDIDSATELIRVLNNCPKWQPTKRGGQPINIQIKYPMVFKKKPTNTKQKTHQN